MNGRSGELAAYVLATLVGGVHGKDVPNRGHHEAVLMRQIKTIEAINELRAIGHGHLFGVAIENIKSHSAEYRVTQSGHLLQLIPRRRFAAGTIPRAPFIHDEFDR